MLDKKAADESAMNLQSWKDWLCFPSVLGVNIPDDAAETVTR